MSCDVITRSISKRRQPIILAPWSEPGLGLVKAAPSVSVENATLEEEKSAINGASPEKWRTSHEITQTQHVSYVPMYIYTQYIDSYYITYLHYIHVHFTFDCINYTIELYTECKFYHEPAKRSILGKESN